MVAKSFAIALFSLASAATHAQSAAGNTEAAASQAQQAQQLLMPFKQQLKQALVSGMQHGIDGAIGACRDEAPRIAATLSHEGVAMGRTSHKVRNPANAATEWQKPLLDYYLQNPSDQRGRCVTLADGRYAYVEPIAVQPMCLTCHGKTIAPGVQQTLSGLYPQDQATGFNAGDFRGLFWVTLPASAKP